MTGKHGNIVGKPFVAWQDKTAGTHKQRLERALASDGTEVIHTLKPIHPLERKWGFTLAQTHYKGIGAEIFHLLQLNPRKEVFDEIKKGYLEAKNLWDLGGEKLNDRN